MNISKKVLSLAILAPLFFIGCGGETSESSTSFNGDNYVKVAKSIYAGQNGGKSDIAVAAAPAPGQSADADTLYLKKIVKPRNLQISEIVVQQGDTILSINVDDANKYATVTLSGDEASKQTVDMKTFTLSE